MFLWAFSIWLKTQTKSKFVSIFRNVHSKSREWGIYGPVGGGEWSQYLLLVMDLYIKTFFFDYDRQSSDRSSNKKHFTRKLHVIYFECMALSCITNNKAYHSQLNTISLFHKYGRFVVDIVECCHYSIGFDNNPHTLMKSWPNLEYTMYFNQLVSIRTWIPC